jgi:hypothetical protein
MQPVLVQKLASIGIPGAGLGQVLADLADNKTALGTTQADAYESSTAVVRFTTVPAGTGVKLDNGSTGDAQLIINDGDNALAVYPALGTQINQLSTNEAYTLLPGEQGMFYRINYARWAVTAVAGQAFPVSFTNYTSLRAYRGRATEAIITDFGIGGLFTVVADETAADNGGTIIVDARGRRWVRVYSGAVDVKWFGAKGDWSWDTNTGTDDYAAFVACRDYCRTVFRKMLVSYGSYRLTQSFSLGTNVGSFPYSGFNFEGDGAAISELVLDYDGARGLDINPGTGGYTAFANAAVGGFKISVPLTRVVNAPFWCQNSYDARFFDIHVRVPAACADASFTGFRVGGAMYYTDFANIWVEVHTGVANIASRAFYIGNGLADLQDAGATTSTITFRNSRAYGFGVNWDNIYSNAVTFLNCDGEVALLANFRELSTTKSKHISSWEEGTTGASFIIDRTMVFQADGSQVMGPAASEFDISGGLINHISLDYAYNGDITAPYNEISFTANTEDVRYRALKQSATINGGQYDARGESRATAPIIRYRFSLGNKPQGWWDTSTGAEWLLSTDGDDIQLKAYRTDGAGAFRGWRMKSDATGGWLLESWFTPAAVGSEAPQSVMRGNISGVSFYVPPFPSADNAKPIGDPTLRWSDAYVNRFRPGAGAAIWTTVTGSPEGALAAPVGSLALDDSAAGGKVGYLKAAGGSTAAGWTPFGVGPGGQVTQLVDKTTSVTLNTQRGEITMNNAALAANTIVSFTLNNSFISAHDTVVIHRKSGGTAAAYRVWIDSVATGSCVICVENYTAGPLSESPLLQYEVRPGAIA